MKISIRGYNSRVTKREVKYATEYMSSLIMSPQLITNLDVLIEFKDVLIGDDRKRIHADVDWLDDNNSPREFRIRIDSNLCRKKQLLALAHELVHVKQWARNEMKDVFRGPTAVKWKKEPISEKVHYYDLPWEIEAHGREFGMWRRYMDHLKGQKISWKE